MGSIKVGILFLVLFSANLFAQQRVAFVTSVSGNANLSSWADAGANTGLAAGDAICQARAAAGGLANAENFVALLSDSNDDAYCRLTGLSGKKADWCGQASLPTDAGPWVNTLGENFAESLPDMLFPKRQVYRPLQFDEFGQIVNSRYYTGSMTGAVAAESQSTCDDWTSAATGSIITRVGDTNTSGEGVLFAGSNSCVSLIRLACFETVAGDPLVPESPLGSLAFVTSEMGAGDLSGWASANGMSGINAADEICQSAAFDAGLQRPEAFIAWISDDSVNAIDRFEYTGPWFRQDGVVVAHNLTELTSGSLNAPNNLTENMLYIGNIAVWTGTSSAGTSLVSNCQNWQSADSSDAGVIGIAQSISAFSNRFGTSCNFSASRLHCFHNVALDLIFKSGFE